MTHHIQIVLYNSVKSLRYLVGALNIIPQKGSLIKVHFLENSEEDSAAAIKHLTPKFQYTYEKAPENLGFGRAHNYLFKRHHKEYGSDFIITNPDTMPFFDFVDELEKFKRSTYLKWGIIELTQFPNEHPKDFDQLLRTEWASGAACVIKTQFFKEENGFDENIFMYGEDVDFSWRIRERGYVILHCPLSRIAHVIGESTRSEHESTSAENSPFQDIFMNAGNLYLRYKYFGTKKVQDYQRLIKGSPNFPAILEQFAQMSNSLTQEELSRFRTFKIPHIYDDQNYAKHRW